MLCGSYKFVPTNWTCKKQAAVSHCTESKDLSAVDLDHGRTEAEQTKECHESGLEGMGREEGWLKCVTLNVSALGTEKPLWSNKGSELHMFIGIEHRLRREAADQERNAWAKKGFQIAPTDARSTKEVEDGNRTSGVIAVKKSSVGGRHCWRQSARTRRYSGSRRTPDLRCGKRVNKKIELVVPLDRIIHFVAHLALHSTHSCHSRQPLPIASPLPILRTSAEEACVDVLQNELLPQVMSPLLKSSLQMSLAHLLRYSVTH